LNDPTFRPINRFLLRAGRREFARPFEAADAGNARPAMIAAIMTPKVRVISKVLMLSSSVLLRRRLEHELQ
jgi:hypothetical protein